MSNTIKIIIVAVLAIAICIVVILKQTSPSVGVQDNVDSLTNTNNTEKSPNAPPAKAIPRLVDVGAKKCIPCKLMAPILEELKSEYEGTLIVEFIDVWKNPEEAPKYGIKLIPTQIFFDASGKERFRHEGFMSREDILAKWKELGVELKQK